MITIMYIKSLPPELIIAGFIENEAHCNYELYLLELVNKSPYFLHKSKGQSYHAPSSEANHECDCISDSYELDFKLIASQSLLRAKSDLSRRKTLLCPGVVATTSPRKKNDTQIATQIHVALREFDLVRLSKLICTPLTELDQGQKDVYQFLNVLDKEKNLLLFFPYTFSFKSKCEFHVGIMRIQTALNNDFHPALLYRKQRVKGFETYMACFYDMYIIFFEERGGTLAYADRAKLCDSPTYMELIQYIG